MSREVPGYEFLCKGGFGCSSLWLGSDHLLYIEGSGLLFPVREKYRRIRYSDIESIAMARTSMRVTVAILLTLFATLTIGSSLSLLDGGTQFAVGKFLLGFLLLSSVAAIVLLIRHLIKGPSCLAEISTCIGSVRPRPLRRWQSAVRAIDRLEEKIRDARGVAEDRGSLPNAGSPALPSDPQRSVLHAWERKLCGIAGALSFALSLLLMAMVVLQWTGGAAVVGLSLLALSAVSALFTALARSSRRRIFPELALALWFLFFLLSLLFLGGLIQFVVLAATRTELVTDVFAFAEMFGRIREISPDGVANAFLLAGGAMAVTSMMVVVASIGGARSANNVSSGGSA